MTIKTNLQSPRPWIGVDFDGTLAFYENWVAWNVFGPPIEPMLARVKRWVAQDKTVKIVTARVFPYVDGGSTWPPTEATLSRLSFKQKCAVTGQEFSVHDMVQAIQRWTVEHVGVPLAVTCGKDYHMTELWDDRAVQVVPNTGRTLAEEWPGWGRYRHD